MPSKLFLTIALFLLCYTAGAQLGLGTRITVLNPTGDIGLNFKKALCYEVFAIGADDPEERFRQRMGLIYSSMQPRLDSFPSWGHRGGNDPLFLPGNTSFQNLTLAMFYGGIEVKTLRFGNFVWYNGVNLAMGYVQGKYTRNIETLLSEEGEVSEVVGGFIFRTSFDYRIADFLSLSAELSKSSIVATTWTTSYGHYNYGIGITYHFN